MNDLRNELRGILNRHCAENGSDTPDFVLAAYLLDCLVAFDKATKDRAKWYTHLAAPSAPAENRWRGMENRWRDIDSQGNVAAEPTPDPPDDSDEGETGPPEVQR